MLIYAFLIPGIFCAIAQIILDNSKLTPGHVTSLFTVIGSILAFMGIYDDLISLGGGGATTLISNFGYNLYIAGMEGLESSGLIGLFSNILTKSSLTIVSTIVFASIFALIFKPKD